LNKSIVSPVNNQGLVSSVCTVQAKTGRDRNNIFANCILAATCEGSGVTGPIIPRPDYTRVYYGLGQFIPWDILWPVRTPSGYKLAQAIKHLLGLVEDPSWCRPLCRGRLDHE